MSDIEITVEDFGGHSGKNTHKITRGKLNIVGGSSASGKSSLVRGAQFALVGGATRQGPLADEIKSLHLDDGSSEGYGLVHSGKSQASAKIVSGSEGFSSSIGKSGSVSGLNNNMKAAYTTMLSSQPESILHEAVMKETNGDDFSWVVDDLSDANNYLNWSNTLHTLKQEIISKRTQFKSWKSDSKVVDEKIAALSIEYEEMEKELKELAKGMEGEMADTRKELDSAKALFQAANASVVKTKSNLAEAEYSTRMAEAKLKDARASIKINKRKIDSIEDILREGFQHPDTTELDKEIEELKVKRDAARGSDGTFWKISEAIEAISNQQNPTDDLVKWENYVSNQLGDNEKLKAIQISLSAKETERRTILAEAAKRRQEIASARQNLSDVKRHLNSAKQAEAEAIQQMPHTESKLRNMREKLEADSNAESDAKRRMEEAQQKWNKFDQSATKALESRQEAIDTERTNLRLNKKSSFLIRYDSLGMMGSDTIEANEELGDAHFSGIDRSDKSEQELLERNLSKSSSEIEGLLLGLLKQGKLSEIVNATFDYAEEKAKEHREKAREIFNQVGATIFTTLSFSPMQKMELDSSYQLKISWKDGRVTGLSGSGGERTIVAAAMLIAMRRAYTPEIPLLFFDGVMGNLNDKARKELESFLASYAESTDIAVVATLLTDSSQLKIETR